MTKLYNVSETKSTRRRLRSNLPPAEMIIWNQISRRQILGHKFRRQYGVGPYILDFYCPILRLAIEIDGDSHYQPGEGKRDITRQHFVESFGISFLRFTNTDVTENLEGVLQVIYESVNKLSKAEGGASSD